MSSAARKIERNQKKEFQKDLTKKVGMFGMLSDKCHLCEKLYDKKSKEMAQTWFVNVFEDEKIVDLFCPDCWSKVNEKQG